MPSTGRVDGDPSREARRGLGGPDQGSVPAFALYGEADRDADLRFIHVESLAARNRLHRWDIRPHRHYALHQLLLVRTGGGAAMLDEGTYPVLAPMLITVPAHVVHGFRFEPESDGVVLTMSAGLHDDLLKFSADAALTETLAHPLAITIPDGEFETLNAALAAIEEEFIADRVGRTTVIAANLLIVFARLSRLHADRVLADDGDRRGARLFRRFRLEVERGFRQHRSVDEYARDLATTRRTLHRVCRRFADDAPQRIIHRRLVLEAKRNLLFTAMSVSEVAASLGFSDAGYFTRFFTEQTGMAPSGFRRSRGAISPTA